ncbi:MAG TPA: hypothetical protein VK256_06045 [Candidatus Eisenbacteria bacterium]|nr:hypothetical protein [Candidatus Eisenbacteria bacterium]
MPGLTHLWQRFLLASSLLVGLFIGVAATIFGYSNKTAVDVSWSIFHVDGVPLWTVAVVPLVVVLVAGTLYHWMDGLHHFTEHMRHRHRVHELEAEVAALRAHLDQVLEMPDHSTSKLPRKPVTVETLPPAEPSAAALAPPESTTEPEAAGDVAPAAQRRFSRPKRVALAAVAEPSASTAVTTNGGHETPATEPAP